MAPDMRAVRLSASTATASSCSLCRDNEFPWTTFFQAVINAAPDAAAAAAAAAAAELDGRGNLPKMKMLQKMRLLEEQGSSFATTAIKDLKVFGE
jgi:hypothetical protein